MGCTPSEPHTSDDVLIVDPNPGKKGVAFGTVVEAPAVPDRFIVVESVRGREAFHWLDFQFESAQGKPWLSSDRWIVVVPYNRGGLKID